MPDVSSSPPVAVRAAHEEKGTIGPRLRQLLAALFFDLGLCYSGRHYQLNRKARAMCCNGWREMIAADGYHWFRLLTHADPRFAWESEPATLLELHSSVNPKFLKKPGHMPGHDRPWGPPRLTAVERASL